MLGGYQLRAFGPPHEHLHRRRRHRRRTPAPRARERGEVRGAQPPQHFLPKEVGQVLEQGASNTDGGESSGAAVVIGTGGGRRGVTGCRGGACGGGVGGGGGGDRAARGHLCGRALASWFFAGHRPCQELAGWYRSQTQYIYRGVE